jgi:PTS system nitrogen regulatory IIA component
MISEMIAPALATDRPRIEQLLLEREGLQSTGIGDGVAIPHASLEAAPGRTAALLICPAGVPFDAVDGQDARIIIGVVGPKQATSDHLRVLARISRLLRDGATRERLIASVNAGGAYALIESRDRELG